MTAARSAAERAKFSAAQHAADSVEDGMRVGLGTGSTAAWMVRCLGRMVREDGLKIMGVPTSQRTAQQARTEGIPLTTLDEAGWLDLTIDGADEFDAALDLIKGGGGALLHEKIVAAASERLVVITDATKEVAALGAFALPVEVIPFGVSSTRAHVDEVLAGADVMGREIALRMADDAPYRTDEGNHILDLSLRRIGAPGALSLQLNQVPGVVENGLFVGMCDRVVIGHGDGRVEIRDGATGAVTHERIDFDERENIFRDDL